MIRCFSLSVAMACLMAALSFVLNALFFHTDDGEGDALVWKLWVAGISGLGGFYLMFFSGLYDKEYLRARSDKLVFIISSALTMIITSYFFSSRYRDDGAFSVKGFIVGVMSFFVGIVCSLVIAEMLGGWGISVLKKKDDES
jgi:drug/metabolite transporter (DMT)-like permease